MRRSQRLIAAAVLIALCGALAGCSSSLSNWDPSDMFDWLDTKKKLPGDRKPVFPQGVPVCLNSQACVMTGVGETLLPLSVPKMPCVMVNPCVPVATRDVFAALGLRSGELLVGASDVFQAPAWPEAGASVEDWVEALAAGSNDLEAPAMRIQPVIGDVLAALNATDGAWLARMSGSGATCFAIYENTAEAQRAAQKIMLDHPTWWVHAGILS